MEAKSQETEAKSQEEDDARLAETEAQSQKIETREEREARWAEEDAEKVYHMVKKLPATARWEIRQVLGSIIEAPIEYAGICPCGEKAHHLSQFAGDIVEFRNVRAIYFRGYKKPLVIIDLRAYGQNHKAYVCSKTIARKLERLLKEKETVVAEIKLDYDIEM